MIKTNSSIDKFLNLKKEESEINDVVTESTNSLSDEWDYDEAFFEAELAKTYIIRDAFYDRVDKVLSTPDGDRKFRRIVEKYLDRNSSILYEPGPITPLLFLNTDKKDLYNLFSIDESEIKKAVKEVTNQLNAASQFRLANNNPHFILIWCIIRYYTMKRDSKGINVALSLYACASYPSIISKYLPYGANKGVMIYTIDNLTAKFTFKQSKHTFGALMTSITASYKFLAPFFIDGSDKECIRWIQRVRNDQNSLIKKIKNEYTKNYNAGLSVSSYADSFEDTNFLDTVSNNSAVVEEYAQKVVISLITNGLNLQLAETAARFSQVGTVDVRYYLSKIITKQNEKTLNQFIESVLFIYLYDSKHKPEEIHSKMFLSFGIELFRRTNSGDPNVKAIKDGLEKWAVESGIYDRFKREASRINYKKSVYWYILLSIQKYA